MDAQEAIDIIRRLGFGGASVWSMGEGERQRYMGCLLNDQYEPDYSTNVWDWQNSVGDVYRHLVDRANSEAARR